MTKLEAIVLRESLSPSGEAETMLRFWGIEGETCLSDKVLDELMRIIRQGHRAAILGSAGAFRPLLKLLETDKDVRRTWSNSVHSAFIYAGPGRESFSQVAQLLVGDGELLPVEQRDVELVITDEAPHLCQTMSGLRVTISNTDCNQLWVTAEPRGSSLISAETGTAFLRANYYNVPMFLSTSRWLIDLDAPSGAGNFDVRRHFMASVPIVLYIKWAFSAACWHAQKTSACLIIDDPVLKPKYGFLNFETLLNLTRRHGFMANVAFVPWNRRRTDAEVARLFRENPHHLSLSVHGCDHTNAEFGTQERSLLNHKVRRAIEWMEDHTALTGIAYDRVMVFPQGIFTYEALTVLKRNRFVAAVNTGIVSASGHRQPIRFRDVWNVALTNEDGFSVFSRRYPTDGVENFAFDILLGKPCLVVTHHDSYRDNSVHLVRFIEQLNGLHCSLSWCSLADTIHTSYRLKELTSGEAVVEMFGTGVRLENFSETRKQFFVRRRGADPSGIEGVFAEDGEVIRWSTENKYVVFSVYLEPGQSLLVRIVFREDRDINRVADGVAHNIKTALRRYASEARDNHVHRLLHRFGALRND
jgi:hypothetical protein